MRHLVLAFHLFLGLALALSACASDTDDAPADERDGRFIGAKADGLCVEAGSPEANAILRWVDGASFAELDDPWDADRASGGAGLNRLAAQGIVERRPFGGDLAALDAVPYVGNRACELLQTHVCDRLGLCEVATACDPDAFEPIPRRTAFTTSCLDALLRVRELASGPHTNVDADLTNRCEAHADLERRALDWALAPYDATPAELSDAGEEFGLDHETRESRGERADLVGIDSWNDGTQTTVVYENDRPLLVFTDDGLATDEHWTCGAEGEPAIDAPWGGCARAFFAPACELVETTTLTVEPGAGPEIPFRVRYAAAHYGGDVPLDVPVDVEVVGCAERARLLVTAPGRPSASYEVSGAEGEAFLLTITDEAGTRVLCQYDFESL